MKLAFLGIVMLIALAPLSFADGPEPRETIEKKDHAPFAIATFHCLSLYWSPPGGAPDKQVFVRYRRRGASQWKEALPMRYNPIPDTDEDLTDFRGSIVHLTPATTYEIELTLAGTSTTANFMASSPRNYSVSNNKQNLENDYDYDLFNGRIPSGQESHGVRGEPVYAEGAGLDPTTKIGHFQLAPGSAGVNAGRAIPNFSDGYTGFSARHRRAPTWRASDPIRCRR